MIHASYIGRKATKERSEDDRLRRGVREEAVTAALANPG